MTTSLTILQHQFAVPVITLITLGLLAYIWIRHKRQRPYSTEIRKVTLAETWDVWICSEAIYLEDKEKKDNLLGAITKEDLDAIREDLITLDKQKFSSRYPLTQIRREIMASIDWRALNEELLRLPYDIRQQLRQSNPDIIQDDHQAERYLSANELRQMALREYASQRFGDRAKSDWLNVYLRASKLKQTTLRGMMENRVREQGGEETVRQHAIQLVDEKLREKLLRVPPGTKFEGISD